MEFWRTILVLLRRKTVALPVILFSLGVAAIVYLAMPTRYMSAATVVLTTSPNGGILTQDPLRPPQQINPLRNFDGMKTAASILIQVVNTREVGQQIGVVPRGDTTFTVSDGSAISQLLGSNGPFIVIEGYSTSRVMALDIVERVEQRLRDELLIRQRMLNAPPSTFMGLIEVVPPSIPESQETAKLQTAGGALVFVLAASIGVVYFAHRIRGTAGLQTVRLNTAATQGDRVTTTLAVPEPPPEYTNRLAGRRHRDE